MVPELQAFIFLTVLAKNVIKKIHVYILNKILAFILRDFLFLDITEEIQPIVFFYNADLIKLIPYKKYFKSGGICKDQVYGLSLNHRIWQKFLDSTGPTVSYRIPLHMTGSDHSRSDRKLRDPTEHDRTRP
jgi:hypothetical protein